MGAKVLALVYLFVMTFCQSSDAQVQGSCACTECPAEPLDRCDFYFTGDLYPTAQFGNATKVPVLT